MLAPALSAIAAFRLFGTPLQAASLVLLAASCAATAWRIIASRRADGEAPRPATALQHVFAALAAFFLFVSFTLP